MDDFSMDSIIRSKNGLCAQLVDLLTEPIKKGISSIYDESVKLCMELDEPETYLKTFQTFLSRIPKWNSTIIENEKNRIVDFCNCHYLADLISCVHITQLKALACIRVGQKQKQIDIDIPSLEQFIHKLYINVARKLYKNIYLYENSIPPLLKQKNNREIEIIIIESILFTIRENMPIETILNTFIAYTEEEEEEIIYKHNKNNKNNKNNDNTSNDQNSDDHKTDDHKTDDHKTDDITTKNNTTDDNKTHDHNKGITQKIDNNTMNVDKEIFTQAYNTNYNDTLQDVASNIVDETTNQTLNFSNLDSVLDIRGNEEIVRKPKNIERLEQISNDTLVKEKEDEQANYDDERLHIGEYIDVTLNDDIFDTIKFDTTNKNKNDDQVQNNDLDLDIETIN
jgi:hypothetical protein